MGWGPLTPPVRPVLVMEDSVPAVIPAIGAISAGGASTAPRGDQHAGCNWLCCSCHHITGSVQQPVLPSRGCLLNQTSLLQYGLYRWMALLSFKCNNGRVQHSYDMGFHDCTTTLDQTVLYFCV